MENTHKHVFNDWLIFKHCATTIYLPFSNRLRLAGAAAPFCCIHRDDCCRPLCWQSCGPRNRRGRGLELCFPATLLRCIPFGLQRRSQGACLLVWGSHCSSLCRHLRVLASLRVDAKTLVNGLPFDLRLNLLDVERSLIDH